MKPEEKARLNIDRMLAEAGYTLAELLETIKEKSAAIAAAVGSLEQLIGAVDE